MKYYYGEYKNKRIKIKRGNIVECELDGKIIPYFISYNWETQLLDVYCMICGEKYASDYNRVSINELFSEMNVLSIKNVIDLYRDNKYGLKANVCKKPVRIKSIKIGDIK